MRVYQANHSLNIRKEARNRSEFNRAQYNQSVSNEHVMRANENIRMKEANEQRIKQLEEIEQRMVQDLQNTLQMKNQAINQLAEKSKGLKKVM